jgi:hypothetical protein
VNILITLANTQKGDVSIVEYFNKIKSLAAEMAATNKKLNEEDNVSYLML